MWLMAMNIVAQTEPEYRLELGAGAGLVAYEGDYNDYFLKGMQPLGEAVVKYKMNPRMAWALNVGVGRLKGSSDKAKTWYPDVNTVPANFSSTLVDVAVRYEYNFWPFGTGREYHGAQQLTPFISLGLGVSFAHSDWEQGGVHTKHSRAAGQLPLGLGVKYKLGDRWNLAAEWTMHFTGNDYLDGVADPYGIKSVGLFKNTDCYSVLGVTLTYDLWAKCKTCHNDKD